MAERMSRHELVELVKRIIEVAGTEQEIDEWLDQLEANVPDPEVANLIYYPDRPMTPEEIIDRALAYKPIQL